MVQLKSYNVSKLIIAGPKRKSHGPRIVYTDLPFSPPIGSRSCDRRMASPSTNQRTVSPNIRVRSKYDIVGEKVNDMSRKYDSFVDTYFTEMDYVADKSCLDIHRF